MGPYKTLDSLRQHRVRILMVLYLCLLTLLLLAPDPKVFFFGMEPGDGASGYAHFITFVILAFLIELGREAWSIWVWFLLQTVYMFLTEIIQHFVPGRSYQWEDLVQDAIGVIVGFAAARWVRFYFRFPSQSTEIEI